MSNDTFQPAACSPSTGSTRAAAIPAKPALVGGQRLLKDDLRIEAYGTIDELNSFIGLARESALDVASQAQALGDLAAILRRVQHQLFNAGSVLATLPEDIHPKQPRVTRAESTQYWNMRSIT